MLAEDGLRLGRELSHGPPSKMDPKDGDVHHRVTVRENPKMFLFMDFRYGSGSLPVGKHVFLKVNFKLCLLFVSSIESPNSSLRKIG
jgi:hypothetical protein